MAGKPQRCPKIVIIGSKQRHYKISAEWLRMYQRNQRRLANQTEDLLDAIWGGEVEPCEVHPCYELGLLSDRMLAAYVDAQRWRNQRSTR